MTSLGQTVRALRLGFGPCIEHGCFLRISGPSPFLAELHPLKLIPNSFRSDKTHWVWWAQDSKVNVNDIQGLRHLRKVKLAFSFYFDDQGRTI